MEYLHTLGGGAGWAVDYLCQMIADTVYPYVKELLQFGVRVVSCVQHCTQHSKFSCTLRRIHLQQDTPSDIAATDLISTTIELS